MTKGTKNWVVVVLQYCYKYCSILPVYTRYYSVGREQREKERERTTFDKRQRTSRGGGNDNAAFPLQKPRMAFIEAHASKPVRQADIRIFSRPKEGRAGSVAELYRMIPVWCS